MLVLTRGKEESIIIGDDITITVVDIRGDKVRIGIEAPRHMVILRKEIYEAVKEENIQAADSQIDSIDGLDDLLKNRQPDQEKD